MKIGKGKTYIFHNSKSSQTFFLRKRARCRLFLLSMFSHYFYREVEDKKTKLITSNDSLDIKKIKYIGGVDVSFPKNKDREYIDKVHACVTLVVTEFEAADSPNFLTKVIHLIF